MNIKMSYFMSSWMSNHNRIDQLKLSIRVRVRYSPLSSNSTGILPSIVRLIIGYNNNLRTRSGLHSNKWTMKNGDGQCRSEHWQLDSQ